MSIKFSKKLKKNHVSSYDITKELNIRLAEYKKFNVLVQSLLILTSTVKLFEIITKLPF